MRLSSRLARLGASCTATSRAVAIGGGGAQPPRCIPWARTLRPTRTRSRCVSLLRAGPQADVALARGGGRGAALGQPLADRLDEPAPPSRRLARLRPPPRLAAPITASAAVQAGSAAVAAARHRRRHDPRALSESSAAEPSPVRPAPLAAARRRPPLGLHGELLRRVAVEGAVGGQQKVDVRVRLLHGAKVGDRVVKPGDVRVGEQHVEPRAEQRRHLGPPARLPVDLHRRTVRAKEAGACELERLLSSARVATRALAPAN